MKPQSGQMIFWRFKEKAPCSWRFGYCTYLGEMIRLGCWNGDTMGGAIVDPSEIEWREYQR